MIPVRITQEDCCLHQLFEANKREPNAVALIFKKEQVTYAELNRCANQLAHHLRSLGVGPEVARGDLRGALG